MRQILRYIVLLCSFLGLSLLSACQPKLPSTQVPVLDIGDGGFLSGEPCGPPCFWDITPDNTTDVQSLIIIQKLFDIRNCDQWPKTGGNQDIGCESVAIQFTTFHKVANIGFSPTQKITIEDAIAKFGNPDAVDVSVFKAGYTYPVDKTTVWMDVFFDKIKTIIHLPEQEGELYNVEPESQIVGIAYIGIDKWEYKRLPGKPWSGFHQYNGEIVSPNP